MKSVPHNNIGNREREGSVLEEEEEDLAQGICS
jgi:hypothetical protein